MSTPNPATTETETPVDETSESAETESTDETAANDGESSEETPAEGEQTESTETDGEAPADGERTDEKPPEEPKALKDLTVDELSSQLSEEQLQRVAQKFSNRTMAAARKAERAANEVKAQNQQLTTEVTTYKEFVDQLWSDPMTALRRTGRYNTVNEFLDRIVDRNNSKGPAKPEDEVAALRKRLDDKEAADNHRANEAKVEASKRAVTDALAKEPDRFDLVTSPFGQAQLWEAIRAYHKQYGNVPDHKVFEMADAIERHLEAAASKSKKFSPRPGANKGTPAATPGQNAASRTAKTKTITNRASSGAPAIPDYSKLTEAERDRKILEDMRAAGEI